MVVKGGWGGDEGSVCWPGSVWFKHPPCAQGGNN